MAWRGARGQIFTRSDDDTFVRGEMAQIVQGVPNRLPDHPDIITTTAHDERRRAPEILRFIDDGLDPSDASR